MSPSRRDIDLISSPMPFSLNPARSQHTILPIEPNWSQPPCFAYDSPQCIILGQSKRKNIPLYISWKFNITPLACAPRGVVPLDALNRFDEPGMASGAANQAKRIPHVRFQPTVAVPMVRNRHDPHRDGCAGIPTRFCRLG